MSGKIALIAVTAQGVIAAERIKKILTHPGEMVPEVQVFNHNHCQTEYFTFSRLREIMPMIWSQYSVLIFVMATGIVVRQISTLLQSKAIDPAVLVIDENMRFVIPLVSGHLGGANAWAKHVAHRLGATVVITTATDGQGLVAPDEYARRLGWTISPLKNLPRLNRLLLERKYLKVWSEHTFSPKHPLTLDGYYHFVPKWENADLIITAFPMKKEYMEKENTESQSLGEKVFLIPRILGLGIGCRRGTAAEAILEAIRQALTEIKAPASALKGMFSINLKSQENGLIQAALELNIPFRTFSQNEIQVVNEQYHLSKSEFVKRNIGVDGVCEPASLLGVRESSLILPKLKLNGVSVAISQERFLS